MTYCKNCTTENLDDALFCKSCGKSMNNELELGTIRFRFTYKKMNPIIRIFPFIFATSLILTIILVLIFNYNDSIGDQYRNQAQKIYDNRQKQFELKYPYSNWYNSEAEKLAQAKKDEIDETSYYYYRRSGYGLVILAIIAILNGIVLCASLFFLFRNNLRWKRFILNQPFQDIKNRIKHFVFDVNKKNEIIRIIETQHGELILKDKEIGKRGYFYLLRNDKDEAELIGEKHNTQAFIREVFGKNINFIEN